MPQQDQNNESQRTKEEEVALLEVRLQAYVARTSLLQSRLLSALNALDVTQNTYEREIDTLVRDRDHLKTKINRYSEFIKTAELERDNMREAVSKLVEKVELSNSYSKWPHGHIILTSLADNLFHQEERKILPEEDRLSYAASVMESLRKERDNERTAHAQTRKLKDAKIITLEAKLSRCEAELESCVAGVNHMASVERDYLLPIINPGSQEPVSSEEEVISMLDGTAARNKMLEVEIQVLAKKLAQARASIPAPTLPGSNQFALNDPTTTPLPHYSSSRRRNSDIVGAQEVFLSHSFVNGCMPLDVSRLEQQIQELGSRVDAFSKERQLLSGVVGPYPRPISDVQTSTPTVVYDDNSLHHRLQQLEGERDRLQRSETTLRDQLNDARDDARQREQELLDEIHSLKVAFDAKASSSLITEYYRIRTDQVENLANQNLNADRRADSHENLLDPRDGEMSMELATPLLPTSMILGYLISPSPEPPLPRSSTPRSHSYNHSEHSDHLHLQHQYPVEENALQTSLENDYVSYVDPPSVPLPSSPGELADWEGNSNSPTLSQIIISAASYPAPPSSMSTVPYPELTSSGPTLIDELQGMENGSAEAQNEFPAREHELDWLDDLVQELRAS